MQLNIKRLAFNAILPSYSHDGDAAMNLHTVETAILQPGDRKVFRTGIAMSIPAGYAGLIWDRSGLATKSGLKVLGGVIDSGYRGEIGVGLVNLSSDAIEIKACDNIAQMLIQEIKQPLLVEVEELDSTSRGEDGFGSTGR